eukprot:CAMPEP_0170613238 /NCGR_PEP_ID=MMETSP0224-20130122/24164_1 /TAXON_ID=285029 /ORGANISM="Togula jolla, Strain CCCM 725" /LENGTH=94 /DNA_ID=CAMNT_0010938823 /DNA_START=212 /DNA_END=496 /DNA_ORIENTATION=+
MKVSHQSLAVGLAPIRIRGKLQRGADQRHLSASLLLHAFVLEDNGLRDLVAKFVEGGTFWWCLSVTHEKESAQAIAGGVNAVPVPAGAAQKAAS